MQRLRDGRGTEDRASMSGTRIECAESGNRGTACGSRRTEGGRMASSGLKILMITGCATARCSRSAGGSVYPTADFEQN
jgi:hypothetical protein